jgi:hypothetical protein
MAEHPRKGIVVSLQDEFQALETPPEVKCKVCDWLRAQSEEDQAFFERMSVGNKVRLHKACEAMGLDAEITTLRHHVRRNHVAG